MCGIALVLGPGVSSGVFGEMLAALAPRGERLEVAERPGLLAGTQRLAIVDRDRAVQPGLMAGTCSATTASCSTTRT